MLTNFYIDGFNLYYRALRNTPFRWLDLRKFAEMLFPNDEIHRICYFTALLNERPDNPGQPWRQLTYLRALETLPGFEIHYGTFRPRVKTRRLAEPIPGLPEYVRIMDSEEKGTDVNRRPLSSLTASTEPSSSPSSCPTIPTWPVRCDTCGTSWGLKLRWSTLTTITIHTGIWRTRRPTSSASGKAICGAASFRRWLLMRKVG